MFRFRGDVTALSRECIFVMGDQPTSLRQAFLFRIHPYTHLDPFGNRQGTLEPVAHLNHPQSMGHAQEFLKLPVSESSEDTIAKYCQKKTM